MCLTQSAVSQRVRQLEEQAGQILLTRSVPPAVTDAGKWFLAHYLQVRHLEEDLANRTAFGRDPKPVTLSVGVNADSLATWFPKAVAPCWKTGPFAGHPGGRPGADPQALKADRVRLHQHP